MRDWVKVTSILCAFGLLREIRPSEPFISEFLLGEWRNITDYQLNQEVYPVATYSYLLLLVVVFLVTDFLRFKPIIILSGLSGIAVYIIILWTSSLIWLQVSQFAYGLFMATEVAYLTYIYTKVDSTKYPKVSSYTRMAALIGRFLSGVSSQLLVMYNVMNYRDLNYITFGGQVLATFWAFWLPPVQYGIYFHRKDNIIHDNPINVEQSFKDQFLEASRLICQHSSAAYRRPKVIVWSLLYAMQLALFVQAQTYMQLLWKDIQTAQYTDTIAFNGFVEAALTLLGVGGAYLSSVFGPNLLPTFVSVVQGLAVFAGTYFQNIYVSYAGYIVMGMLFHYTITLASAKTASQLSDDSCFGLIFGINTLVGTGFQSLLTFVMIHQLGLSLAAQYYVVSGLFIIAACLWLIGWMVNIHKQKQMFNINKSY